MVFAIRFVFLHPMAESSMSNNLTLQRFNTTGGTRLSPTCTEKLGPGNISKKIEKRLVSGSPEQQVQEEAPTGDRAEHVQSPKIVNSGLNSTLLLAQSGGNEFKALSTIEPLHLDSEIELSDDYKLNVLSSISSDFDINQSPLLLKLKSQLHSAGTNSANSILAPLREDLKLAPVKSIFKEHSAGPSGSEKVEKASSAIEHDKESDDDSEAGDFDISSYYQSENHAFTSKWKLVFFGMCAVVVLALLGYIPLCIQLHRGSWSSTLRYINRIDDNARMQLFSELFRESDQLEPPTKVTPNTTVPAGRWPMFNGIAYSPLGSLEPQCGVTLAEVEEDLIVLSSYTNRIRNYGLQCNQTEYILEAISRNLLNMTLAMGIWISDSNDVNNKQIELAKELLRRYSRSLFDSIFVGNEVLFRQDKTKRELIALINEVKSFVKEIGYGNLPVGTSELGSLTDKQLMQTCDVIGVNVHPFFGGVKVEEATHWTHDFIKYQIEPHSVDAKIVVTEVGWPYQGGNHQEALANPTNFQYFMNDWVCRNQTYDYFYFEAFDEPWKLVFYEHNNTWETEWGIFNNTRGIKQNVRLPSCLEHIDLV